MEKKQSKKITYVKEEYKRQKNAFLTTDINNNAGRSIQEKEKKKLKNKIQKIKKLQAHSRDRV